MVSYWEEQCHRLEFFKNGEELMSNYKILLTVITIFVLSASLAAQPAGMADWKDGSVVGLIVNNSNSQPLEYAYIIIYSQRDSSQAGGTVTDKDGFFELKELRPGRFYLEVQFMGFDKKVIGDIRIGPRNPRADLSEIRLSESTFSTDKIEVSAERPGFTYHIDKKVINVAQQMTVVSGTAVDVLENVPSITTDIDGNVQLRGSSSFVVLIDSRPAILEANDALQQIPASAIDKIEIITNPSVKFDPDGTSGIINIITKKDALQGMNGLVNLNTGMYENYGADFLINLKTSRGNYYFGGDYRSGGHPGDILTRFTSTMNDTTSELKGSGHSSRAHYGYSIRLGLDYNLTKNDLVGFSLRTGERGFSMEDDRNYTRIITPGDLSTSYRSKSENDRGGLYYGLNTDYRHLFNATGHEIKIQGSFQFRDSDNSGINRLIDENGSQFSGQKTTETGPDKPVYIKVDYTWPRHENSKFEAGGQYQVNFSDEEFNYFKFDPSTSMYISDPLFDQSAKFIRNTSSAYTQYSGKIGELGYQGGLRTEQTFHQLDYKNAGETLEINRWDYFPSLHFSYQVNKTNQFMLSYTRRIERPHGWDFSPFIIWIDAQNVRQGNPNIKPQFINSIEAGYQTFIDRNVLSIEGYHRVTENKIDRVRSIYDRDITLHATTNVGQDYTTGAEIMLNMSWFKIWNANLMGSLYHYRVEGNLFDQSFDRESFNWTTRLNNTLTVSANTRLQMNAIYNSPSVSAQGTSEGFGVINLGLRQEFLNESLSATLQVRDVFSTGKFESTSEGQNFESYIRRDFSAPVVMLNLSYKINNYEQKRRERSMDENGNGEGMDMNYRP